jgi:hypothetical protein
MAVNPYGRTTRRSGVVLNWRTVEMLEVAEMHYLDQLGIVPLRLAQGSYTTAVAASGGTHAGGGALDVSVRNLTTDQRKSVVWALRKQGFAAWLRTPAQGFVYHIHAIAVGDHEMSAAAAQQVVWYKQGLNGLWPPHQGPDDGPRVAWTEYRQEIDLSYYGPERWDARDKAALLDIPVGEVKLPDGRTVTPDVGQCMRAAYWLRFRLATGAAGADTLAQEMFSADGIFRNMNQPETLPDGSPNPAARGPLAWFISDLENTQDIQGKALTEVAADVAAVKAKVGA